MSELIILGGVLGLVVSLLAISVTFVVTRSVLREEKARISETSDDDPREHECDFRYCTEVLDPDTPAGRVDYALPSDQLVVEQCTDCGEYRSRTLEEVLESSQDSDDEDADRTEDEIVLG